MADEEEKKMQDAPAKDAEGAGAEDKKDSKPKKEKKPKKEGSKGMGVLSALMFLVMFMLVAVIFLGYLLFEKVNNMDKRLNEEGKYVENIGEKDVVQREVVPLKNIEVFPVTEQKAYYIKGNEGEDRILILTITLGLNKKGKGFSNAKKSMTTNLEIVKEEIESILLTTTVADHTDPVKIEKLKYDMQDVLNAKFDTKVVASVIFSDKLIQ